MGVFKKEILKGNGKEKWKFVLMSITFSEKDIAALNACNKHSQRTDVEYCHEVKEKINLLLELVDSLHEQKILMADLLTWSEPLIFKLAFHSSTLLQIFSGTEFNFKDRSIKIFDEPSALILFRTILENYLTFYYIFIDKISDEEKIFRLNVWKYCGLKQRTEFIIEAKEAREKQKKELIEVENLRKNISSSAIFQKLDKDVKTSIIKGKKPRLYSWEKLISLGNFRPGIFRNLYSYKSTYAHSEFLSVLQIKSNNYGFNPNHKEHYVLFLLHTIICKSVIELAGLFPSVKTLLSSKSKEIICEIEFFYQFATDAKIDFMTEQGQ